MSETRTPEDGATLTEDDRELLSGLCESEALRGPGEDGYCFKHFAPVKWAGHGNADDVCCIYVEDVVEQLLDQRNRDGEPS